MAQAAATSRVSERATALATGPVVVSAGAPATPPERALASVSVLRTALPRRVAVVALPVREESFGSWVDRVADQHQIPPGQAAITLGMRQ